MWRPFLWLGRFITLCWLPPRVRLPARLLALYAGSALLFWWLLPYHPLTVLPMPDGVLGLAAAVADDGKTLAVLVRPAADTRLSAYVGDRVVLWRLDSPAVTAVVPITPIVIGDPLLLSPDGRYFGYRTRVGRD